MPPQRQWQAPSTPWLIYRCTACGASWNRPVFERRLRAEIDGSMLDALQRNDPAFAQAVAGDAAGLARRAGRFDEGDGDAHAIERSVLDGDPATAARVEIGIACRGRPPRADRLLSHGLGLSRARLASLVEAGRIEMPGGPKALSRPPRDGAVLSLDLAGMADGAAIALAAAGLGRGRKD